MDSHCEKFSVHLVRQTDVKEAVSVVDAPVARHHTVLQLTIASVVRIGGLEAGEHCLAHPGVLGQAEAVGGGQEHRAVVIEVSDLHNHGQGPPPASGDNCACHLVTLACQTCYNDDNVLYLEHDAAEVPLVAIKGFGQVEHLVTVQSEDRVTRGEAQLQTDIATNLKIYTLASNLV